MNLKSIIFVYSTTSAMRKILVTVFAALFAATALVAQTPEEILARMDQETNRFGPEGCSMVMEIKIPLLGTVGTTAYILGEKYKMITAVKDEPTIIWSDGKSNWEYNVKKKEVVITPAKPSGDNKAESNVEMVKGVTEGYDVRLKKETDDAWHFRCTKSRSNTNKDDPKNMDLVVSKATYLPISVKTSMTGITVTLRDFAIGVSEAEVTFHPSDYPDVQIVDNREQ